MMQVNFLPSLLAANIATRFLKEDGLLIFTGAYGVFNQPAPDMMSYTLSKNLVHNLANNLSESNSLHKNSRVITILP